MRQVSNSCVLSLGRRRRGKVSHLPELVDRRGRAGEGADGRHAHVEASPPREAAPPPRLLRLHFVQSQHPLAHPEAEFLNKSSYWPSKICVKFQVN